MLFPIFLDTNIPIYAAGQEHPLKEPCVRLLTLAVEHPANFVTDAEVLQELLHRYRRHHDWPLGRSIIQHFALLMEERIEDVCGVDVQAAVALLDQHPSLSARDLLHLAIMDRLGVKKLISADRDFDAVARITRLDPGSLDSWREAEIPAS